ncbi:hypothetical protein [Mesorhizobium huakuii]|uniref:Uncharacterized protein n=1 Tax=Mesorhizobium huakuii TaxID=28104 RepID=A0A7G6SSD1_9HYPH|nr:hypothetical protein [Mesorhizobium huakuii]QND57413.1 hypothetical protein HB778_12885 [Mesorhizobium huakuii]
MERILGRVAAAGPSLPNAQHETDPVALARSISWAYTHREIHPDLNSDARSRNRFEALDKVRRSARAILHTIADAKLPINSLEGYFPFNDDSGLPDFEQLMAGIRHLASAAEQERARLRRIGRSDTAPLNVGKPESDNADTTPGDVFIKRLAKAYRDAFKEEPEVKFTSIREASGPFVAFVAAVSEEMEDPMSAEAIRKAWERASGPGQRALEI